jgi:rhamnosyl/mannosyltransferase
MGGLDATLVVAGDGPLRAALAARACALGIANRVVFLGDQPDLRPLFAACDLFVLPSTHRSEAFGIVQLEAMAFGKPVVSTRLGTGVDWVNVHGVTGLTVPPGDPAALRMAIATLLASPTTRARFGTNGRRRVEQQHTAARAAEAVLKVYAEVTGRRVGVAAEVEGRARDVA